jgi:4-hydroxy-tetrahydrodipicolinate synthase
VTSSNRFCGVLSPVVTPFKDDLSPDPELLIRQCKWLLSQNVGLAVFGTNSEANSLSVSEKIMLLEHLVNAGVDPKRMMPGTGCCALPDTVELTRHTVQLGCAGTLMLPPFYYKGVSDDGLFRSYAEVIERTGDDRLRIYLYHIPPIAQVSISPDLVERLVTAYPDIVVGMKDSSGDWSNTRAVLQRKLDDFRMFVGSESFLLQNMQSGGAGCISATANVNPAAIDRLYQEWKLDDASAQQAAVDEIRSLVMQFPMIPALKATVAKYSGDTAWQIVRPPLVALSHDQSADLYRQLDDAGFRMPGLSGS